MTENGRASLPRLSPTITENGRASLPRLSPTMTEHTLAKQMNATIAFLIISRKLITSLPRLSPTMTENGRASLPRLSPIAAASQCIGWLAYISKANAITMNN